MPTTKSGQGIGLNNMQACLIAGITGDGGAESYPHGMGAAPAVVLVIAKNGGTFEIGTSTKENIVITAFENLKLFDVLALWYRD
jgi:hypothetical protein